MTAEVRFTLDLPGDLDRFQSASRTLKQGGDVLEVAGIPMEVTSAEILSETRGKFGVLKLKESE